MASFLEIPSDSKYFVPGIELIPEEINNGQHYEDHNILGKLKIFDFRNS